MANKATRKAFGEKLAELGAQYNNLVVLDADLSKSTQSIIFAKKFPKRFIEMGIAESNMISTAAGLAYAGKKAYCCSFACFITGRYDQIRMSVAYPKANVVVVGTHSGIGIGEDGNSQMGLEDVTLMRGLPNMQVFQPADETETHQIMDYLSGYNGPAYLRLTRQNVEDVCPEGYQFKPGKGTVLKEGADLVIFASGGTVKHALDAANEMDADVAVINIASIKPIDKELVSSYCAKCKMALTAEDHNVIGGLGTAIAEVLADGNINCKLHRHGIYDVFGESGTPEDLYKKYKLDAAGIKDVAQNFLKK